MTRRPAVRKSDLSAALEPFLAAGLKPRSVRFYGDGGFGFGFEDGPPAADSDTLDAELAAFEAKHGQR